MGHMNGGLNGDMTEAELQLAMQEACWPHAGSVRMAVTTYLMAQQIAELELRLRALEGAKSRNAH